METELTLPSIEEWFRLMDAGKESMMSLDILLAETPAVLLPVGDVSTNVPNTAFGATGRFLVALSQMPRATAGDTDEKLRAILGGNVGLGTKRLSELVPGVLVELYQSNSKYPEYLRQV